MTSGRPGGGDQPDRNGSRGHLPWRGPRSGPGPGSGYTYLSYLIGGMLLYGFIGWLIGRWTNLPVLFPIGMLVGLALAVILIIYRVTRS